MTRDQLISIRASAASIVAMCDRALSVPVPVPEGPCAHPEALRTPAPRMGRAEAWVCACGEEGDG